MSVSIPSLGTSVGNFSEGATCFPPPPFKGEDALDAAIRFLQEKIKAEPVPKAPAYPNKALPPPGGQ